MAEGQTINPEEMSWSDIASHQASQDPESMSWADIAKAPVGDVSIEPRMPPETDMMEDRQVGEFSKFTQALEESARTRIAQNIERFAPTAIAEPFTRLGQKIAPPEMRKDIEAEQPSAFSGIIKDDSSLLMETAREELNPKVVLERTADAIASLPAEVANIKMGMWFSKYAGPVLKARIGNVVPLAKDVVHALKAGGKNAQLIGKWLSEIPDLTAFLGAYGFGLGAGEEAVAISHEKTPEEMSWKEIAKIGVGGVKGSLETTALGLGLSGPLRAISSTVSGRGAYRPSPKVRATAAKQLGQSEPKLELPKTEPLQIPEKVPPTIERPVPKITKAPVGRPYIGKGPAVSDGPIVSEPVRAEMPRTLTPQEQKIGAVPRQVFKTKGKTGQKIQEKIDKLTTNWVDDLDPIIQAQRALNSKPEYVKDPYVRFRLLRGVIGKVQAEIEERLVPALRKVKNMDEFLEYAVAKKAVEKGRQKGYPIIGEAVEVSEAKVRAMETPEMKAQLEELVGFQNRGLWELYNSGMLTKESYLTIKNSSKWQIPFERPIEGAKLSGGGIGGMPKRIKGSDKPVINILENIVKTHSARIKAAETNQAYKMFVEWANPKTNPGAERFIRKVKRPALPIEFEAKEIQGKLSGVIENPEKVLSIFRAPPGGKEYGQINVWTNGKRESYEFTKDGKALWEAIEPFPNKQKSALIEVFGKFSKMLRWGATGANPDFWLRNLLRDTMARTVVTEGSSTLSPLKGSFYKTGIFPDTTAAFFDVVGKTKYYNKWKRSQGALGGMHGYDANTFMRTISQVKNIKTRDKLLHAVKHPFDALRKVGEVLEDTSRLAEYKAVSRRLGAGAEQELRAAMASRDVSLDFFRVGKKGKEWNEVISFFNAGVQDLSKVKRTFQDHPVRTVVRGIAWMAPPTILEANMNKNNKYYDRLSSVQKALYWNYPKKDDQSDFVVFPKPFLWGGIFAGGMSNALQWLKNADYPAFKEMLKGLGFTGSIPMAMNSFTLLAAGLFNTRMHTMSPIVGEYEKKHLHPYMQSDDRTSKGANILGRLGEEVYQSLPRGLGSARDLARVSPKKIDAIVSSGLGGVGRTALDLGGRAAEKVLPKRFTTKERVPKKLLELMPGIKGFIKSNMGWIDANVRNDFKKYLSLTTRSFGSIEEAIKKGIKPVRSKEERILYQFQEEYAEDNEFISSLWKDYFAAKSDKTRRNIANSINNTMANLNKKLKRRLEK